ncbi:ribonuclease H-like domain-containing protein, partial [Tanacetum coccineum]
MTDYSLWEVIKNGNKVLKRTVGTVEHEYEPTTAEENQDRRNEMKARATLLMALPNKDQLKFHSYQDAKLLMEAIEKRYGGNKESKKVQRILLKQQYENFAALSSETMDQTFNRLQKLISQLEIQGEVINQEDINLKLLRSLPSEWKTHDLIWRNKVEIKAISLDDLHNNLKIYESELTGSASTSQNPQNVAFVSNSTNSTNNTNKADNTSYEVSTAHTQGNGVKSTSLDNLCDAVICAFLVSQPNFPQLAQEDLEQLHPGDLEERDLQWEMAMLTIRTRRFIRNQENKGRENNTRTITVETLTQNALIAQDGIGGYDWSYQAEAEQPTNYALMAFTSSGSSSSSDSEKKSQFNLVSYKAGLESVEARLAHYKKNEAVFETSINVLKLEVRLRDNALDEYKMKLDKAEKERDQLKQTLEKFQNSSKSLNDLLESQSGSDKGYHSVPLPLTGNFIPRKPDLTFIDEIVKSENMDVTTVVTPSNDKTVENKGVSNTVESNAVRMNNSSAPIIEDWNSDDESEIDYTVRPSTEKIKSIKTVRETDAPKQNKHHPRGNQRNWNNLMSQRLGSDFKMINKACYVCGSFEHLYYVCDKKVNHKNFSNKMTHPHPKRSFVPQAVLTRTGKINTAGAKINTAGANVNTAGASINTVNGPINTVASTPIVNHPRPKSNAFKRGYSQSSRPFNIYYANKNSIINTNVNTARVKNTTVRDRAVIQVYNGLDPQKSLILLLYVQGNPQQKEYKEKAVIDNGCSRHITGNKCYLDEYEDYDGGFVSFGDGKGIISGKVKYCYELIRGRPLLIDFMKPFGCHVTILNTRDHLGKFEGNADEGYFVGYSVVSRAMRVFNKRTRIVEETLNIRFLENLPNVKGNGPDWLFDVDSLSISMNYVPVVAGNKTNGIAGTKDNIVAGQDQKEKEPEQEYILIPLCTTNPLISQGPKDSEGDAGMKPTEVDENQASNTSGKHDEATTNEIERLNERDMQTEHTNSTNGIKTISTPVSTTGPSVDTVVSLPPVNTAGPSVSTANAFEEHLFERFSPFKNAFTL